MKRQVTFLLDLNFTLVGNSEEKASPFIKQIAGETYRQWLVDLLKGHPVILWTARPAAYRDVTLERIKNLTGWSPDRAIFNTHGLPPPQAKERMFLEIVSKEYQRPFFAIESNPKTRAMLEKYEIKACPAATIQLAGRLPTYDELTE